MLHKNSATYWVQMIKRLKSCENNFYQMSEFKNAIRKAERKLEQVRRRAGIIRI